MKRLKSMRRLAWLVLAAALAWAAGAGEAAAQFAAKTKVQKLNDMRQIGLFYVAHATENGKGPANQNELKEIMAKEAPKQYKLIEDGDVVVVYGLKPKSSLVIAYEKKGDSGNNHVVAMGDGSVQTIKSDELLKALQNKD